MQLVHHHIAHAGRLAPEQPAIISDDRAVSYGQLLASVDAIAAQLAGEGIADGDRVVIFLRDKIDLLLTSYAVMKIGAIAVHVPYDAALFAVQQVVADCTPSLFVTNASDLMEHKRLRSMLPCNLFLVEASRDAAPYSSSVGLRNRSAAASLSRAARAPRREEGALIRYTAGAGAQSKGVLHSQASLIQTARNIIEFTGIGPETREFVTAPLARSFGFGKCTSLLFAGGTIILNDGPLDPVSMVQSVLRHRCNALSAIPSVFMNMFGHMDALLRRIGSQIRFVELGSSAMSAYQKRYFLELFPNARIAQQYGFAEAPRTAFLDLRREQAKIETVGSASPHVEVAVRDGRNKPLAAGSTGEIVTRGAHLMLGYWNDEALTRQAMTPDGWFKTGDYGVLDSDGYLTIKGRRDGMISIDGVRFSTLEIEEHVRELYPNHELCVVGVPDPAGILGEIPVLCYVGRNGQTITASDLSRLLSDRLDKTKIPRIVLRIDPESTRDGKLVREDVQKQFLEESAAPIQEARK